MNAATVLAVSGNVSSVKMKNVGEVNGQKFNSLLSNAMNELKEEPNSEIQLFQANLENGQIDDLEELENLMRLIIEELPLEAGYLSPEMLNNSETQTILNLLPEEMQQQIIGLFESNQAIEALLDNKMDFTNILSIVIALDSNELTSDRANSFVQQLQHHFPPGLAMDMPYQQQLKKFLENLGNVLSKINEKSVKSGDGSLRQLDIASFLQKLTANSDEAKGKNNQLIEAPMLKQGSKQTLGLLYQTELTQPLNKIQQFSIHAGDQQTKHAQAQEFMKQFEQVLKKSNMNIAGGMKQLTIKLFPEHLGRLDIRLTQMNGIITAKISAASTAAKELIDSQVQQLRTAFMQQQLQVDRIEVTQQQQEFEQSFKEKSGRHEQEEQSKQERNENDSHSFQDVLEHFTFNEEV